MLYKPKVPTNNCILTKWKNSLTKKSKMATNNKFIRPFLQQHPTPPTKKSWNSCFLSFFHIIMIIWCSIEQEMTHGNHLFLESLQIIITLTGVALLIFLQSVVKNCWHGWGWNPQLWIPLTTPATTLIEPTFLESKSIYTNSYTTEHSWKEC